MAVCSICPLFDSFLCLKEPRKESNQLEDNKQGIRMSCTWMILVQTPQNTFSMMTSKVDV